MTTKQQRGLRWLIGLSILAGFVVIDVMLESRRAGPTSLFLGVLVGCWLIGRLLRLNRPWVWPLVLAIGIWLYPMVPLPYQRMVAAALPASAMVALAAPRMRERRVATILFGVTISAVVLYFSSNYYLSAKLLFLAGMWCLLVGYGLLAAGSGAGEPVVADARDSDPAR
jgi:hypothetical protein